MFIFWFINLKLKILSFDIPVIIVFIVSVLLSISCQSVNPSAMLIAIIRIKQTKKDYVILLSLISPQRYRTVLYSIFNSIKWIEEFELIIIDDNSTDNSLNLLKKLFKVFIM